MPRFLQTLFAKRQDEPEPEPVVPYGAPRSLHLQKGTYPVMCGVRYTVSGGSITRVREGTRTLGRDPAPEEWDRFWRIVERLGVCHWRADYREPRRDGCFTLDGKAWRFSLDAGTFTIRSGGTRAYPSLTDPKQATTSPEALEILRAELDRLIAGPREVSEL